MKYKKYFLYLLLLNGPKNVQSQVKATFHPRAAPVESWISMQPINPSLNKAMIVNGLEIVTGKYLMNL